MWNTRRTVAVAWIASLACAACVGALLALRSGYRPGAGASEPVEGAIAAGKLLPSSLWIGAALFGLVFFGGVFQLLREGRARRERRLLVRTARPMHWDEKPRQNN